MPWVPYLFNQVDLLSPNITNYCSTSRPGSRRSINRRGRLGEHDERVSKRTRTRSGVTERDPAPERGETDGKVPDQANAVPGAVHRLAAHRLIFVKLPSGRPGASRGGEVHDPEAAREAFGLNKPIYVQYARFAKG